MPGTVSLQKDANNLIGISIGGGAQYCPCLYIVQVWLFSDYILRYVESLMPLSLSNLTSVSSQVFDNTPAALEGTLAAGDEITGVNGKPVKGKTKVEVAKMIQAVQVQSRCLWIRDFMDTTAIQWHI